MANKLDRKRDHGIVAGISGVKFEQDNRYFNAGGEEVNLKGQRVGVKETRPKPEPKGDSDNGVYDGNSPSAAPDAAPKPPKDLVLPGYKHRGGARFQVWDEDGNFLGGDYNKQDAIAMVERLKEGDSQIGAALDG